MDQDLPEEPPVGAGASLTSLQTPYVFFSWICAWLHVTEELSLHPAGYLLSSLTRNSEVGLTPGGGGCQPSVFIFASCPWSVSFSRFPQRSLRMLQEQAEL